MKDFKIKCKLVWWYAGRPIFIRIRNNYFCLKSYFKNNKETFLLRIIIILIIISIVFYPFISTNYPDISHDYIQIITSFITGFLTMVGVAWTLISQEKNKKTDRRLSVKPFLVFGSETDDKKVKKLLKINCLFENDLCFESENLHAISKQQLGHNECLCSFLEFDIHNADFSECAITSLRYRKEDYFLTQPVLLRKNSTYTIDLSGYIFLQDKINTLPSPMLCITDMQENDYYYSLDINEGLLEPLEKNIFNNDGKQMSKLIYQVEGLDERTCSYEKIVMREEKRKEKVELYPPYFKSIKKLFKLNYLVKEYNQNIRKLEQQDKDN